MLRKYIRLLAYLFVFTCSFPSAAGSFEEFFQAIHRDDPDTVQHLLNRGFDPNTVNESGVSALFLALRLESLQVVETLVAWPTCRIDARNGNDETPLMLAVLRGHLGAAKSLLARDADVNKPGWAPLHYAATSGNAQVLRLLLERHAYIDAESPNGTTPLMMASRYGSAQAVALLIEAGADVSLRNQLGLDALDFAVQGERVDAIGLLRPLAKTPPK
jgi:ankyrin repeat protein